MLVALALSPGLVYGQSAVSSSLAGYDLAPRPLERIAAGTVIDREAPEGWTHLVIKSVPRLDETERAKVAGLVARLATSFTTNIVARVRPPAADRGAEAVLDGVAIGLSTPISGRDVVVNADQADRLGANLGIIGNLVLGQADGRLDQVVTRLRSSRLLIFDVPGLLLEGERHADVVLRYALIVSPDRGELTSWVWVLGITADAGLTLDPLRCRLLAPNTLEQCAMHIDPNAILAGVPGPKAFGVVDWPPGKELRLGEGFRPWLTPRAYTASAGQELERQLLGLAARVASAPPNRSNSSGATTGR